VLTVYSINSNPTGLTVQIDGTAMGKTPATASPAYAKTSHVITIIAPGSALPYSVTVAQTAVASQQIFYNSLVDTAAKIASLTPGSILRHAAVRSGSIVTRVMPSLRGRALYSDHRLSVTYDAGALGGRSVDALERRHGAATAVTLTQSGGTITRVVTLAAGQALETARQGLAAEAGVRSVDRVALRYPMAAVYPNDTHFNESEQWDFYRIDTPDAWGFGLGSKSIAAAIVDTGYDPNQPDVAPNVTFAEKVLDGYIDTTSGAATDTDGHGTVDSGIASAVTNNGAGWAGVAYGAALQEYKIFPDGPGAVADTADESEAIREAVGHGAKVILLSLGGSSAAGPDPVERDAVAYAITSGVTVVAATGDERTSGVTTIDYPAAYPNVIAVGASAVNDSQYPGDGIGTPEYVASYSNSGPGITMVAPGGDPSPAPDNDQVHWIENAYTTQPYSGIPACASGTAATDCGALFAGTSMAAAHVAGAAALLLSQNAALTPAQVMNYLTTSADDIGDPLEGAGRLNVYRAMANVTGNPLTVPAKVTPAYNQFIAFAYTNLALGQTVPVIADITYPHGVPVNSDGTFRIADLPASINTYRIAVWYDSNGDGKIDAGDYFAVTNVCAKTGACGGAGGLAVKAIPSSPAFVLP
jgi:subtilisin family serine protease